MNLLSLIEHDTRLRKTSGTRGGEWHGPCPFCGGRDRFIVQPNHGHGRWSCRQCSPRWNDDISYLMRRNGISFIEARRLAGRPADTRRMPKPQRADPAPSRDEPEALANPGWQAEALRFAMDANRALFQPPAAKALDYLLRRGLDRSALVIFGVGYNAEDRRETWGGVDVFLPRGIVLPWFMDETVWKLNVRRPLGEPKYQQARGSANGLYGWDYMADDVLAVLVEGEFDALSLWPPRRISPDFRVLPLATGSVSGARMMPFLFGLGVLRRVLLAFDDDDAGDAAAAWWRVQLGPAAQRLRPTRHDPNAMLAAGDDVWAWVEKGLRAED